MMEKVDQMAADLVAAGLIPDPLVEEPFRTRLARLFDGLGEQEFLAYGRSWRDRLPGYFVLMSNPKIIDAVESLIGPEIFSNPVYNVRPKVPKVAAGAVPWHQDKSYWPDANSNPVITVWIPLVDATPENGCLRVVPRTQHTKVLSFHEETYSSTGYLEVDDSHLDSSMRRRVKALPVKAGTAILFNDRLIHSSTGNNSDHVRWSVDLRYQPTDQDPMPQYGAGFLARSAQASGACREPRGLARRPARGLAGLMTSSGGRREPAPQACRRRLGTDHGSAGAGGAARARGCHRPRKEARRCRPLRS